MGLNGATNTLKPASFDTDIGISLGSGAAQSLDSTVNMGALTLRGTGVKTIITTGTVGQILMIDGNGTTANSATTLRLGSNITLFSGAGQLQAATFSQTTDTTTANRTDFAIDTNGFILDLSTGGSSGIWTPNVGVTGNLPTWTLSGSGTIKANAFNFNTATVTTNVGSGVTLQAVGTNSTATDLSGTGTINAGSTFLYSGNAATGTPAVLTSNRSIGNLNVSSGALRINSNLIAAGLVTVGSGATLNLSTHTLSATGLTFNNGLLNTPGNLTVIGTGANVLKTGANNNTLILSNANNSYTGTTTLQDGNLQFTGNVPLSANSALGNATSAIIMGNSSSATCQRIILSTTTASTVGRAIDATSGTSVAADAGNSNRYRISQDHATGATLTLDGNVSWGSTGGLAITRAMEITALKRDSSVVINGLVSSTTGAGGLLINGGNSGLGSVALNNVNNSFSQGITVTNGSLLVGGNAPATTANSVLGTSNSLIILGDGGTAASNWTTTGANELLYGQNGNPAMLIAGAFTVGRGVSLSNVAAFSGGNAPAVTGNGVPNSYVLGGSTANASVLSGAVTVSDTSANKLLNLTQATGGGTFTVGGVIGANPNATGVLNVAINAQNGLSSGSNAGNYQFSSNAGTVILTNNNTYDGTTTVGAGKLVIAGNHTGSGQVVVNNNATLQFGDGTSTNGSVAGSGTIFVNTAGIVQLNKTTGGTLANQIASNPSATTTLGGTNATGSTNTFTATSFSNGGAFAINSTNSGAVLAFSGASPGAIDLKGTNLTVTGSGDTLFTSAGSGIYSSTTISSVTKTGTGTLIYHGNQGYTGTTGIDSGAVRIDLAQSNSGTFFIGNGSTTGTAASLLLGGGSSGLTGGVTFNRNVTVNPGNGSSRTVGGANTSGTNTYSTNIVLDGSFGEDRSVNLTAAAGGTVDFSGGISGAGQNVTKIGSGTVKLSGANTYSGTTTISGGILSLGNGSSTGSLSTNSAITNNANLTINRSNAVLQGTDFSSSGISGSGSLTQAGAGVTTLTVANTYAGGTTVSFGTLLANNATGSATGSFTVAISSGAILGGSGIISGATTLTNATLAPGGGAATAGTLTYGAGLALNSTSIFEWDMQQVATTDPGAAPTAGGTNAGAYDKVLLNGLANSLTGSGDAVFKIVLGSGKTFADAFWDTDKTWDDVFSGTGVATSLASIFSTFNANGTNLTAGVVTGEGTFTFNGSSTVTWSAVPEPTTALAGLLLGAGLLRRRR